MMEATDLRWAGRTGGGAGGALVAYGVEGRRVRGVPPSPGGAGRQLPPPPRPPSCEAGRPGSPPSQAGHTPAKASAPTDPRPRARRDPVSWNHVLVYHISVKVTTQL